MKKFKIYSGISGYKTILIVLVLLAINTFSFGQNVSINENGTAPNASAMLDVSDTAKGILIPRLTFVQRNAIVNPATGLLVYQVDSVTGFYYNQGIPATPSWLRIKTESDTSYWSKNDSNLYYNSGFVGVGTDTPQAVMHLYGKGSLGAGARLVFGDDYQSTTQQWNTFIAESGWYDNIDSDQLQIHSKGGHFFTTRGNLGASTLDTVVSIFPVASGAGNTIFNSRIQAEVSKGIFSVENFPGGTGSLKNTLVLGQWVGKDISPQVRFQNNTSSTFFDVGLDSNLNYIISPNDQSLFTFSQGGRMTIGKDTLTGYPLFVTSPSGGSTFARINTKTGQSGLWFSNDSASWALFSEQTGGSLLPSGAVGLFNANGSGLAWSVTKDGNMGIGTTLANAPLQFSNAFLSRKLVLYDATNNDHQFFGFGTTINNLDYHVAYTVDNHVFYSGSSTTTSKELMRITGNGNVGIGAQSPSENLHVLDTSNGLLAKFETTNTGWGGINISTGLSATGYILFNDGTNSAVIEHQDNKIRFEAPEHTTRMIIDGQNGRVGVNELVPNSMFSIGTTDTDLSSGINLNNGIDDWYIYQNQNQSLVFRDDGFDRVVIDASGNVGIGEPTPAYRLEVAGDINALGGTVRANGSALISDRRYKTDIVPMKEVLPELMKLEAIYHSWDTLAFPEMNFTQKRAIGVIAQDLQKVFPELVTEGPDGYLAVEYAKLSAILIQAIKEQQVLINKQEENYKELQSQIDELKMIVVSSKNKEEGK